MSGKAAVGLIIAGLILVLENRGYSAAGKPWIPAVIDNPVGLYFIGSERPNNAITAYKENFGKRRRYLRRLLFVYWHNYGHRTFYPHVYLRMHCIYFREGIL